MNEYLLGIDIGSGGCKISILDSEGNFVASGTSEVTTYHQHPTWSEQNPADWYQSLKIAFNKAIASSGVDPKDIKGIGVDAPTHNAVILDENEKVLRNTIMWNDSRSFEESKWLMDNHGEEIMAISLNPPSPTWTLPQLMWLRDHEPEVHGKIKHVIYAKDYIRYMLTGTIETDIIDAGGSMFLDAKEGTWSPRLCELASLSVDVMPPIKQPHEIAGTVTQKAADDLGLYAGTPVIVGTSDTAIECYAAGAVETGQCVVKMATAATINLPTLAPCPSPRTATYNYVVPDMWYAITGTNSAALSMRWFRDLLYEDAENKDGAYQAIDRKSRNIKPGSDGLIFHPYLLGERAPYWDPNLRASFVGASIFHEVGHFARAVMEGVTFSVRDMLTMFEKMNLAYEDIRFVGGAARSATWCQILADTTNKPVYKLENGDSSYGSAMLAGVGVGIFKDTTEAVEKCVRIKEKFTPNAETTKVYDKMFGFYKEIQEKLSGTYTDLAKYIESTRS